MTLHCVVCQSEIPEERDSRKAVVCSPRCKLLLNKHRRARKDAKVCRHCSKPSTPEERILYQRWRRETLPPRKPGRPKMVKLEEATTGVQE